MDALALSRAIKAKQVSCVEVMNAYLDHIDALNPEGQRHRLAAGPRRSAARRPGSATTSSRAARFCGWMHGFPQAIKDLTATKGIRTTQGSRIFKDFVPAADAIMVERMKRAGAIIIGKTNTPEFGLGSNTYNDVFGRTLNAYDQIEDARADRAAAPASRSRCTCCRSPTAAITAARCAIRPPSTTCSAFAPRSAGCRRRALDGFYAVMGVLGPMARTCPTSRCCCRCRPATIRACRCRTGRTRRSSRAALKRDFKGTRIAWVGDFGGHLPFEPGILDLCRAALKTFEALGCTSRRPCPTIRSSGSGRTGEMLRAWQAGSALKDLLRRSGQARADEARGAVRGRKRPQAVRLRHLRRQRRAHRLVSGGARLLRALRLFPAAVRRRCFRSTPRPTGRRRSPAGPWTPTTAGWR